jgi:hypothetical protein
MFSLPSFVSEGTHGGEIGFRFAKGQSRDWAVDGFEEFVRPSRFVVITRVGACAARIRLVRFPWFSMITPPVCEAAKQPRRVPSATASGLPDRSRKGPSSISSPAETRALLARR